MFNSALDSVRDEAALEEEPAVDEAVADECADEHEDAEGDRVTAGSRTEDAPAERRSRALAPTKDTWAESWERDGGVRVKEQLREGVEERREAERVVDVREEEQRGARWDV